jgi:hypothetical protein
MVRVTRRSSSLMVGALFIYAATGIPWSEETCAEDGVRSANRILAAYRVDLAGVNLGDFRLTTVFHGSDYEMQGEGRFSLLGGLLYSWSGSTASKGKVTDNGPQPAMYAFTSHDGDGSQQLHVTFDGGVVTKVSMSPTVKPTVPIIPVTKEQLEGVLDPMTAVFLYARSENPNGDPKVCDHTVPVFDGEQRYDLVLKPKRTVKLRKDASTGYSGFAAVCSVKFNPISGYEPDDPDIKLMSQAKDIEVWLVSLPGTAMYVPYRIVLPTFAGSGSLTSTSLHVQTGTRRASLESQP